MLRCAPRHIVFGLACVLACTFSSPRLTAAPTQYTIETLFDVPGLQWVLADEINDLGQTVGRAKFSSDRAQYGWRQDGDTIVVARRLITRFRAPTLSGYMLARHILKWNAEMELTRIVSNGVGQPVFNPAWDNTEIGVIGLDINEAGTAVGYLWSKTLQRHAFSWRNGVTTLLGGEFGSADDINNHGLIVGSGFDLGGDGLTPVMWNDGVMTQLSPARGMARFTNDAGQILVQFDPYPYRVFLWQAGEFTDMCPTLPDCSATDFNEAGQALIRNEQVLAYISENGVLTPIGTMGPDLLSMMSAINNAGDAVGFTSHDASENNARAIAFIDGTLYDLNTFLPAGSGWTRLATASDINNAGQIVGYGIRDGVMKAYRMTPAP